MKMMFDQHIERLLFMFFFGVVFILGGYFIPRIYLQYFDRTEYIQIKNVQAEFDTYKKGDKVNLIFQRRALRSEIVQQELKIVHVNGNLIQQPITDVPKQIAIEATPDFVTVETSKIIIPCDTVSGRNYIEAVFHYEVQGVHKTYEYVSNIFNVTDEKNSSCTK